MELLALLEQQLDLPQEPLAQQEFLELAQLGQQLVLLACLAYYFVHLLIKINPKQKFKLSRFNIISITC